MRLLNSSLWLACALAAFSAACATGTPKGAAKPLLAPYVAPTEPPDPPARASPAPVLLRGATVLTAAGQVYAPGHVLMVEGKIASVGTGDGTAPEGARVIDGAGLFVTPGIIDTHSHMGVYPMPDSRGNEDGNESSDPATPEVWAEHGFWPQDPALWRAVAGGVTAVQVLPGSANIVGGRSFVAKLHPAESARAMRFVGAKQGVKMACGENPKRVHGERGAPKTRMGSAAHLRARLQAALAYQRRWQAYERDLAQWNTEHEDDADPPEPPERDLGLETLVKVLRGELFLQVHCYRADDMSRMLDVATEFGVKVRSFHHALEAYKIRDRLAQEGVAVSTWADWWGFKMEAYDGIPQNAAMLAQAGARVVIHSDSPTEIRSLNQEAAKARAAGRKVGIELGDDEVLRWVTANPAWVLGVEDRVGTLEVGKSADLAVWDHSPFSVYALTRYVFIDGELVFDRARGPRLSDFELGQPALEVHP